jgi:hypothetical protein
MDRSIINLIGTNRRAARFLYVPEGLFDPLIYKVISACVEKLLLSFHIAHIHLNPAAQLNEGQE